MEEAQSLKREAWNKLLPSIRDAGSKIVVAMNPRFMEDPVYKDLVVDEIYAEDQLIIDMPWYTNPFFTEELERTRRAFARGDDEIYRQEWDGIPLEYAERIVFRRGVNWDVSDDVEVPAGAAVYYGRDWRVVRRTRLARLCRCIIGWMVWCIVCMLAVNGTGRA